MQTKLDTSTVDLTRTRVAISRDVRFSPQVHHDETFYHVELRARSQYFRIGYSEYVFLSLLDGRTTFSEALALTSRQLGAAAMTQQQALAVYQWALENGVTDFADDQTARNPELDGRIRPEQLLQKCNPLWFRIPFGRPDALLKAISPFVGWLFSGTATVAGLGFMAAAVLRVRQDWQHFQNASTTVFAPDNWLWLLIAWMLLKVCHELAHGLVCQRYGASVRETGIILAFFAPLAYVDVSSSWSLSSRWKRIHIAVAGMYVEFLLASAAVFLWTQTDSSVLSHLLYNVIVMASAATVLFNANPLMKFDGYYILSDLLQLPNLQSRAAEETRQWLRRLMFGLNRNAPETVGGQRWILRVYGIAAFAWRLLICATILIAASVFFHGAGIVLAVLGVIAWFAVPVWKLLTGAVQLLRSSPVRFVRASAVTAGMLVFAGGILFGIPAPIHGTAPGVVAVREGCRVRADVNGFVQDVLVVDGQQVTQGDLLMTLRNEELTNEHRDLELQIEQETIRQQQAMKDHDAGSAQVARSNLQSLQDRLADTKKRVSSLQVFAPSDGRILIRHPESLPGRFVQQGDDLLMVDDQQPRELRALVSQEDFRRTQQQIGGDVRLRIGTRQSITGRLVRMTPRATDRLPSPALAATEGGPLAVVQSTDEDDDSEQQLRLTEPRFEAVVQLPEDLQDAEPAIGERGLLCLGTGNESLGQYVYLRGSRWFRDQFKAARSQLQ